MLDLESLKKSVISLKTALSVACSEEQMNKMSSDAKDTVRAGVIQNFEFTYELCWKFLKRWLGNNLGSANVDGVSRRELFRLAVEHHLIDDVDRWMEYHDKHNEISRTYDNVTAEIIFKSAINFHKDVERLLFNLEKCACV